MGKILLFAIAGCGKIAKRHVEHITHFGRLAAVCDIDDSRASCFGEQYDVPFYSSIESMLSIEKNVDVVVVCTPNGLHAEHSILSLNAGKHVLCEKPMAITVSDCRNMIRAAEANNRILLIVKQNRYNPPVIALKNALDTGKLGQVYSLQLNCFWNRNRDYYQNSWKGTNSLDGGTLFTQFSHFIDLLYWMFGNVEMVKAITSNAAHKSLVEFEDNGAVLLRFENGIIGSIHFTINAYKKNMEGSLTVFAEKGTVKIGGQYLNTLEYECLEGTSLGPLPPGKPSNEYGSYQGSMSNHDKVYANLLEIINENGTPGTTTLEAMKTVEIISRIYLEAKTN